MSSCWELCLSSRYTVRNCKTGLLFHKKPVFNTRDHQGPSMGSNLQRQNYFTLLDFALAIARQSEHSYRERCGWKQLNEETEKFLKAKLEVLAVAYKGVLVEQFLCETSTFFETDRHASTGKQEMFSYFRFESSIVQHGEAGLQSVDHCSWKDQNKALESRLNCGPKHSANHLVNIIYAVINYQQLIGGNIIQDMT